MRPTTTLLAPFIAVARGIAAVSRGISALTQGGNPFRAMTQGANEAGAAIEGVTDTFDLEPRDGFVGPQATQEGARTP